jgi:hypothetical protein
MSDHDLLHDDPLKGGLDPWLAAIWLGAGIAGYAEAKDWQAWADAWILALEKPPYWLLEASLAASPEVLWSIVMEQHFERKPIFGDAPSLGDLVMGFLHLRFLRVDFSLEKFLLEAGITADRNFSNLGPETFYGILNDLEVGIISRDRAISEAARLLERPTDAALAAWKELQETGSARQDWP